MPKIKTIKVTTPAALLIDIPIHLIKDEFIAVVPEGYHLPNLIEDGTLTKVFSAGREYVGIKGASTTDAENKVRSFINNFRDSKSEPVKEIHIILKKRNRWYDKEKSFIIDLIYSFGQSLTINGKLYHYKGDQPHDIRNNRLIDPKEISAIIKWSEETEQKVKDLLSQLNKLYSDMSTAFDSAPLTLDLLDNGLASLLKSHGDD